MVIPMNVRTVVALACSKNALRASELLLVLSLASSVAEVSELNFFLVLGRVHAASVRSTIAESEHRSRTGQLLHSQPSPHRPCGCEERQKKGVGTARSRPPEFISFPSFLFFEALRQAILYRNLETCCFYVDVNTQHRVPEDRVLLAVGLAMVLFGELVLRPRFARFRVSRQ